jgi:16S rRNA (guanine1207-N2)-methyltransferase
MGNAVVYGFPPAVLADVPAGARQASPLVPGSVSLQEASDLDEVVMLAPPGTQERRRILALALRALKPGGVLIALAPTDKGGSRLGAELATLGCEVDETSKRHHRICAVRRPVSLAGLDEAIAQGAPRLVESLGLWSQPGVFSWDRIDPGTALLSSRLPALKGRGADLGCGIGILAHTVLRAPDVSELAMVDIDRRAVEAARRNVDDPRVRFQWADATGNESALADLDFVVMNPPFHDAGAEDRGLGQAFIRRAAAILRPGGVCWLVANRHLPYEAVLAGAFKSVRLDIEAGGYKVYEARR